MTPHPMGSSIPSHTAVPPRPHTEVTPHPIGVTHSLSHRGPPTTPQWGPPSPPGLTLYLQPDEARPRVWRQHCSHVSEQLRAVQRPSGAQHHRRHPCAALVAFRGGGGGQSRLGGPAVYGGGCGAGGGAGGTWHGDAVHGGLLQCRVRQQRLRNLRGGHVLSFPPAGSDSAVQWGCGSYGAVGPIGRWVP